MPIVIYSAYVLLVGVGVGLWIPTLFDVVIRHRKRLPRWTSFSIKCAVVGSFCCTGAAVCAYFCIRQYKSDIVYECALKDGVYVCVPRGF